MGGSDMIALDVTAKRVQSEADDEGKIVGRSVPSQSVQRQG